MTGRQVTLPVLPQRIISLVPSQTELLYHLGLGHKVVGKTVFCIHPNPDNKNAENVGGTKKVRFEKIDELQPDLIICNKEENSKEMVDALSEKYPVWVSDVKNVDDALIMIKQLGKILQVDDAAKTLCDELHQSFKKPKIYRKFTSLYLIWRKPYMSVGTDTFIHHMMERGGFVNVLTQYERYPEIDEDLMMALRPEVVFLSNEPYPFSEKHIQEIQELLPASRIILVDGELFSWYGNRLLNSQSYFNELQRRIHKGIN